MFGEEGSKVMEKVQFMHFRCMNGNKEIMAKGGMTFCYYPIPNSNDAVIAASVCSPKDNFSKKIGCRCSGGRASKRFSDFYNDAEWRKNYIYRHELMDGIHGIFVEKLTMLGFSEIAQDFSSKVWAIIDSQNPEKIKELRSVAKSKHTA